MNESNQRGYHEQHVCETMDKFGEGDAGFIFIRQHVSIHGDFYTLDYDNSNEIAYESLRISYCPFCGEKLE